MLSARSTVLHSQRRSRTFGKISGNHCKPCEALRFASEPETLLTRSSSDRISETAILGFVHLRLVGSILLSLLSILMQYSFSGSILGQPRLLNDLEAACEYPQDVDDEYITEKEFLTMPPGESTRVSSALALFNGARILSAVLDRIYPTSMHNVTPDTIRALNEDLDDWLSDLAPHLRLRFMQDKPSTQVVGSRSAFLVRICLLRTCLC